MIKDTIVIKKQLKGKNIYVLKRMMENEKPDYFELYTINLSTVLKRVLHVK